MYKIVRPYMLLLMAGAIMTPPLPGIRGGADQRRRLRNIFLYADAGYDLREDPRVYEDDYSQWQRSWLDRLSAFWILTTAWVLWKS